AEAVGAVGAGAVGRRAGRGRVEESPRGCNLRLTNCTPSASANSPAGCATLLPARGGGKDLARRPRNRVWMSTVRTMRHRFILAMAMAAALGAAAAAAAGYREPPTLRFQERTVAGTGRDLMVVRYLRLEGSNA